MSIEIIGKYTTAKIFNDNVEQEALSQIYEVCNHPIFKDMPVRIMPDVHAGKGCVIGFTARLNNRVIPNLIGVDIGCGMLTVNLGKVELDLPKIDNFIRNNIPHGNEVNKHRPRIIKSLEDDIYNVCKNIGDIDKYERHLKSIGSLGGGNHFIEINIDKEDNKYLVIHSGSRNFGHKIATYYQKQAEIYCDKKRSEIRNSLNSYKGTFKVEEDEFTIATQKALDVYSVPKELSFLEGGLFENYIHDMKVAQKFASMNRFYMYEKIQNFLDIDFIQCFETIHNYIDVLNFVRKGAISADKDEKVLIPLNMRDGSILAIGKGNEDWNNSAPHGAGRLMSRTKAKENINLEDFEKSMEGIYSTSVKQSTLDESPMAYKNPEEIIKYVEDTIEIIDIIKPIYNFKA